MLHVTFVQLNVNADMIVLEFLCLLAHTVLFIPDTAKIQTKSARNRIQAVLLWV